MNSVMQLLWQNRGKGQNSLNVAQTGREAIVYVYDMIVDTDDEADWFGGVSAQSFVKEVSAIDADVIHLRINSPGGSVFAARSMETALRNHSARVMAYVDGLAASAASWLMMAADEIEMSKGAFVMIHQAHGMVYGNADDLDKQAALLRQLDTSIAQSYADKTALPLDELLEMMRVETWLTAQDALDKGFIDRIGSGTTVRNAWDLSAYHHAPSLPTESRSNGLDIDREALQRQLNVLMRRV